METSLCITYPSVLVSEVSTSDSSEPSQHSEQSLWWRGKPSALGTWLLRWKRAPWIRALFTTTYCSSPGISTEDLWISSLVASRVNPSACPESNKASTTSDTSGPTSDKEWGSLDQTSASLRTSTESQERSHPATTRFSTMSSATWKTWVTQQQQDALQRRKLGHRTCESDGSSSGWPTPIARDWKDGVSLPNNTPTNGLLGRAVPRDPTSPPGQLNPAWVEQLMGFPIGWTDLER